MNAADSVLQRSFPTVMVPRREPVGPMTSAGERLLVGENGVFLEISLPWISLVRRVASFTASIPIPYGRVEEHTNLVCGRVPEELIGEFVAMARAAYPNETGSWIVWSTRTRQFRLLPVVILSQSSGSLKYDRPERHDDEVLIIDCHSHGRHPAYFSSTDNEDDKHDIKFSLVVGNCAAHVPSFAFRLCAKGIFEEVERVPAAWYRISKLAGAV
ncbi:PRTRC system protein A [Caballeronia sp. M23-90]